MQRVAESFLGHSVITSFLEGKNFEMVKYNADSRNKSMRHLHRDHCLFIACGECVQVCRDQIPRVLAFKHILVLLAENRKFYVFGVFAAQTV